jgi:hypothetical protein
LASQRTCRLVHWDLDVKMPIDATITGEHRLLDDLNVSNAVTTSRIAKAMVDSIGNPIMALQRDVAAVFHMAPGLRPHLDASINGCVRLIGRLIGFDVGFYLRKGAWATFFAASGGVEGAMPRRCVSGTAIV